MTIIAQNDPSAAHRMTFLTALYPAVPDNLFLELRCIHPQTSHVRSLWTPVNDAENLQALLKQADILNREGYGLYFAPCLRSAQKGSAKYAALAPALWIDIDCEKANQRTSALEKLQEFDPLPSVIVDSGGGWHGYWLLNEPYLLESDESKDHIAQVLRGLFAALGGDDGYVKSVASVMRLPDSINTKPERGGFIATIQHWSPESSYPLHMFDWLKVDSTTTDQKTIVTLNGRQPLPPRTADYLASGAADGSRNNELFAAACQLRDAGYSQTEAENQLVARHVADSTAGENTASREREAKATIASAYSQPRREPIASSKQRAKRVVNDLIAPYQSPQTPERPSTDEIVAAVEACIHLNPVEWAEQRAQFKTITGNGLKISDIDQLYKEKKREYQRQQRTELIDTEEYLVIDGHMVYRRHTQRGISEKVVANWTGRILERLSRLNDDGERDHVTVIEVQDQRETVRLEVPSETFGDDLTLRRTIAREAGESFAVRAGMTRHLVSALLSLSPEYPVRTAYSFMGWLHKNDRWLYITPQDCITANGKLVDPPLVELPERLDNYGVTACDWDATAAAFDAMTRVFPEQHAPACIAFALLPLLQRFFPSAALKPALHLAGTYGSGKSELAALMCSFYGDFTRDGPPAQWGDTINTVEIMGHPLSDALYWVDDFKSIYIDESVFTRFLQGYSRGMGRGRLTREAKLRKTRPCRGLLLSTGETTLQNEASVLTRMLVLEIPPWEHRDPRGEALAAADIQRNKLPGFAAHFASWIADQVEDHDLQRDIAHRFASNVKGYEAKLRGQNIRIANTGRVIKSWAVLITVYQLLRCFLDEREAGDLLPVWNDTIVETVEIVREERASEVFLNVLGQLIASGEAVLAEDRQNPLEPPPGATIVGYADDEYIHLLPDVAYRLVNRVQTLKFTTTAIGSQLREDGLLLTTQNGRHLTVRVRIRGSRIRVWRLRSDIFDQFD